MIILPYQRPLSILLLALASAIVIHPVFYMGCLVMYLDMRARYVDYLRIKDTKFNPQIAMRLGKSWCGRGVCLYAWGYSALRLYNRMGYRWYHVFPDGFPRVFFKLWFWKSVVGYRK